MAKEWLGAWCGPHQCHPSECFLEHNPQLIRNETQEVDYARDVSAKTLEERNTALARKRMTEEQIRKAYGLDLRKTLFEGERYSETHFKRERNGEWTTLDADGTIAPLGIEQTPMGLRTEHMAGYLYLEIPQHRLEKASLSFNTLPRMTLRAWGFDPDTQIDTWYDDARGVLILKQRVDDNRVDGSSDRSEETPVVWKDSMGRRWVRQIRNGLGLLRGEGDPS